MRLGKFEIDTFVIIAVCLLGFILGTAYITQLPELKAQEVKLQESKEQELKHEVELKELELKILEENNK